MRFFVFGLLLLTAAFVAESRYLLKSNDFYDDDPLETQILKEVNDLYDNTKKAIDTLSKTSQTELIDGLAKAIDFVDSIGIKVNNLKPTTDLGKAVLQAVNVLVTNGEDIFNSVLKAAKAGTTDDHDYKPKLVADIKDIYAKAKTAYETLEKSDKKTLKDGLTAVVGVGHELQTELNSLHPTTDVGKALFTGVQNLVNELVTYFETQLKSIGYYSDDPIEDALLEQVATLYDNTKKAIDTLAKSGKTELITGLQKAIDMVKSIDDKVKTLTPTTDLGKSLFDLIEKFIAKGEDILNDNLKNAQAGTTAGDHKAELVAMIKEVYEKAQTTLNTVAKQDKKTATDALTKVIDIAKQIETDLKAITSTTDVGKAVYDGTNMLVIEIVSYLELQLKNLGGFYEDDPLETQILKEVNDLYDNTEKAIDTLTKTGQTQLIDGLAKAIDFVDSIGIKVNTLKPTTDLGKAVLQAVNVLVTNGEDILNSVLKAAKAGTTDDHDYKPKLVADIKDVYAKAKTAYETLEKSDKKTLKDGLTAVVGVGHELQTELNSLHPTTDVGKALFTGVQNLVNDIVTYLETQLKSIGF